MCQPRRLYCKFTQTSANKQIEQNKGKDKCFHYLLKKREKEDKQKQKKVKQGSGINKKLAKKKTNKNENE